MNPEVLMTILKIAAVFIAVSFVIFWVGLVWWVAQDILSRTNDKVIIAASVAMTAIFGPVGALLYLVIRPKQTLQESMGEQMEREMMLHASSTTICPTCGRMAQGDFLSCPHCATRLKQHCPQCQKLVAMDWAHCPFCAAALPSTKVLARKAPQVQSLPQAEEPTVTTPSAKRPAGKSSLTIFKETLNTWKEKAAPNSVVGRSVAEYDSRPTSDVKSQPQSKLQTDPKPQADITPQAEAKPAATGKPLIKTTPTSTKQQAGRTRPPRAHKP